MQKLQSGWGSAPDPDGGAYSAPPYPLAGREGATPPPAPTPALNQFHLIAFPNPPVSRPAYGPADVTTKEEMARALIKKARPREQQAGTTISVAISLRI